MALKTLILRKKIDDKKKLLETIREKAAELEKRESELEAAIAEAETEEEQQTVTDEIDKFEAEKTENKNQSAKVESEISELEAELEEAESRQERSRSVPETTRKADVSIMGTKRTKFFEMTIQERDDFISREDVKTFLTRFRELGRQKRSVSGAELTVPEVMLDLIKENIDKYSKLIAKVRKSAVKGKSRQPVMGVIPEAVWTEACGNLNELDFVFNQAELDAYKVGGFVAICNATLEDSDLALAYEIISGLGQSIGIAVDKAIVYGTGIKMPLGIVTRLAQTAKPANYDVNDRPWIDLHTSNIKTIASTTKAIALFQEIITASGNAKGRYSKGSKFWLMSETTKTTLVAQALSVNAAGAIVAGINNTMPAIGGEIIELNFMPDDIIVAGYGDLYSLLERKEISVTSSEHTKFIEDQTVFKGIARYDGKPAIAEGFVAIGLNGKTPTASDVTFPPDTANTASAED